ncbi:MAG TPA: glycosyltransferase family 2 protein [Methylobacter sp.]|jgi:glycosyltransferase involved in cell wall biosynthesis
MTEPLPDQAQGGDPPLVTVAMPVYNAGKYLRLAVLSIVRQTFTSWELLIIDDGSTDNAVQNITDINDARIKILQDGDNRGLAARLNEAADMARGRYFARMDQDDVSFPERFARQIAVLQNYPELDLVATRAITIDENDQAIGLFPFAISHQEICARPWKGFYFPHPTWMGRIEWFHKHRYTVPGPFFCEDQELLLRSYRDSRLGTLTELLFAYRIQGKVDWQKLAKTRRTVFMIQVRHFVDLNQWHFVLLATAAFIGKISSDLLKKIIGGTFHPGCDIANDAIALEWQKIFESLATEPKAP